jgi:hypothetical protein
MTCMNRAMSSIDCWRQVARFTTDSVQRPRVPDWRKYCLPLRSNTAGSGGSADASRNRSLPGFDLCFSDAAL